MLAFPERGVPITPDLRARLDLIPKGSWIKCPKCSANSVCQFILVYKKQVYDDKNLGACYWCQGIPYNFPLNADERINQIVDKNSFMEFDRDLASSDPLEFPEYQEKLTRDTVKTGRPDGMVTGVCKIEGIKTVLCVSDFRFMGGSMGSVHGEKVTRAMEYSIRERIPIIIFTASGGARMQEGEISLMQMIKTTAAVKKLQKEKIPFIVVYTHPTTGGVLASYAGAADIILAEPEAVIGFAGARVAELTDEERKEFKQLQKTESQFERGMIDKIVSRKDHRKTLAYILSIFASQRSDIGVPDLLSPTTEINEAVLRDHPFSREHYETIFAMEQSEKALLAEIKQLEQDFENVEDKDKRRKRARRAKIDKLRREHQALLVLFSRNISAHGRVVLSRHVARPYTLDYVKGMFESFIELHGDREFRDDPAMVAGLALLGGHPVVFIGHQKGRDVKERIRRNFGCARAEGYRKALRIMKLAEKFNIPVISFIDTLAADGKNQAEKGGIGQAISHNMVEMSGLNIPIIGVIIGEGGSGGALGIGVVDRYLMLENSTFSVIPPEGCGQILWPNEEKKVTDTRAAEALKLTSTDAKKYGIVDQVISEPPGGAHRNLAATIETVKVAVLKEIGQLIKIDPETLLESRYQKYRIIGTFKT